MSESLVTDTDLETVVSRELWLEREYAESQMALESLGFSAQDGIPLIDDVGEAISPELWDLLEERHAAGCRDTLVISPNVTDLGLKGTKEEPGLFRRFEQQRGLLRAKSTATVQGTLLKKGVVAEHDPRHEYDQTMGAFGAAILLGDVVEPTQKSLHETRFFTTEIGLVEYGQSYSAQLAHLEEEKTVYQARAMDLYPATVGQLTVENMRRRANNAPLLGAVTQSDTFMPQYGGIHVIQSSRLESETSELEQLEREQVILFKSHGKTASQSLWQDGLSAGLRRVIDLPLG